MWQLRKEKKQIKPQRRRERKEKKQIKPQRRKERKEKNQTQRHGDTEKI